MSAVLVMTVVMGLDRSEKNSCLSSIQSTLPAKLDGSVLEGGANGRTERIGVLSSLAHRQAQLVVTEPVLLFLHWGGLPLPFEDFAC